MVGLVSACELRSRLGISEARFERLCNDGSIFALDVEGKPYYPSTLADARLPGTRLQAICRILAPAPPEARLDFLRSEHGNLGDRAPISMLIDDGEYQALRESAKDWAAQWWRTAVTVYGSERGAPPITAVHPIYTAMTEIDPRMPLWRRASRALHEANFEWPPNGPYTEASEFTFFVDSIKSGYSEPIREARVKVIVENDVLRVRVRVMADGADIDESYELPTRRLEDVISVTKRIVGQLRRGSAGVRKRSGQGDDN